MLPDFNRLRVFYYIYKTGSSTSAGKELHLTQSGVSQHLKKLEQELDYELFTRVNKNSFQLQKALHCLIVSNDLWMIWNQQWKILKVCSSELVRR